MSGHWAPVAQPGEIRHRRHAGLSFHGRTGADQIRILTNQYVGGSLDLEGFEAQLEQAVAKEATETSVSADLQRLVNSQGPPYRTREGRVRPRRR